MPQPEGITTTGYDGKKVYQNNVGISKSEMLLSAFEMPGELLHSVKASQCK
jgi:hypothetical protein